MGDWTRWRWCRRQENETEAERAAREADAAEAQAARQWILDEARRVSGRPERRPSGTDRC